MRSIISLRSNITRRQANITEAHFLAECASIAGIRSIFRALKLFCAVAADELAFIIREILVIAAKDAAGLILLKHDAVFVDKYLDRILGAQRKSFPYLNGENYPSEIVYGANYTR